MPVPATTGSLKTKINELEIGDYIVAEVMFTGKTNDTLIYNLGSSVAPECSVMGENPPDGKSFYFVKVSRGLLVSDRVLRHTITWDGLNTAKFVQGRPYNFGNLIPTMTSNTTPNGVASAGSEYSASYPAWKAFDKLITEPSRWLSADNQTTNWLAYDFQEIRSITAYSVTPYSDAVRSYDPKSWTFEGWDANGSRWVVLDNQPNHLFGGAAQRRTFFLRESASFSKFRLNITQINGSTRVLITEFELHETAGIIRSLTGGAAYADANGGKATADQGHGAWPVSNEWDRFIVNFPTEKIQPGKTLDDVFHWNVGVRNWTQDTPMPGLTGAAGFSSANTARIMRGFNTAPFEKALWGAPSSTSNTTTGFRPVFQYIEGV